MNGIKVTGVFNLVADPEIKILEKGTLVSNFRLANNYYSRPKGAPEGNEGLESEATFLPATAFGEKAKKVGETMRKGTKVLVEGRLRQETWTDKENVKHTIYKVMVSSINKISDPKTPEAAGV